MKITAKGQVTIPVDIRRKMKLLPDTEVDFAISGKQVVLRKTQGRRRRGSRVVSAMRGRATKKMSTDQIMALTRGE